MSTIDEQKNVQVNVDDIGDVGSMDFLLVDTPGLHKSDFDERLIRIKDELKSVPALPGVYLWKNELGDVIYVGKAKSLRNRMMQYVNYQDDRIKIPLLVEQIDSFDYIVVDNEHESLILENNLIKQYSPFFNADFKDDKTYPYIAITKEDPIPSIKFTREKHKVGTKYFGPYTDSRSARQMIDVVRKIVPICSASCTTWKKINNQLKKSNKSKRNHRSYKSSGGDILLNEKECFDSHVEIGPGICCGKIDVEQYNMNVFKVESFLLGRHNQFIDELTVLIKEAASNLDFERADRLKQKVNLINAISHKQNVDLNKAVDMDVIGLYSNQSLSAVYILIIREGKIINQNEYILNQGEDMTYQQLIHMVLLRYYDMANSIPREIVLKDVPEDLNAMQLWLTKKTNSKHKNKVIFVSPKKGVKNKLLTMATENAKHCLTRYKIRTNYDDNRTNSALLQLESALSLDSKPLRIECFDISTNHGSYTVASMVVFTCGVADKSQYRRFKIRTPLDESNDFLCMQEVLRRRYSKQCMDDPKFGQKPDLVILDGGKPQLSAAIQIFNKLGIDDISLAGLAKRDEEIFVEWKDDGPIILPAGSASLYLVKNIRDEAHRFAIAFHRHLVNKSMSSSILDDVEGIGEKRKKLLLNHFGSFKKLKSAEYEDILSVKGIPKNVAFEVVKVLEQYNVDSKHAKELLNDK